MTRWRVRGPTPTRIEKVVRDIELEKLMDGQLDDGPLSLRGPTRIEDRFCQVLLGISHTRPRELAILEPLGIQVAAFRELEA